MRITIRCKKSVMAGKTENIGMRNGAFTIQTRRYASLRGVAVNARRRLGASYRGIARDAQVRALRQTKMR